MRLLRPIAVFATALALAAAPAWATGVEMKKKPESKESSEKKAPAKEAPAETAQAEDKACAPPTTMSFNTLEDLFAAPTLLVTTPLVATEDADPAVEWREVKSDAKDAKEAKDAKKAP